MGRVLETVDVDQLCWYMWNELWRKLREGFVMKTVVFSGINLYSGGTLQIYRNVLSALVENNFDKIFNIIAFVYKKELFADINGNIHYIELKNARKNYLYRYYYEYIYFKNWSSDREIFVWIAMHDVSPTVKAEKKYTYFHSPQIFYRMPANKIKLDRKCFLLSKIYKHIIRINIKKVDKVIVQAQWIKQSLYEMFGINNIIVSIPKQKEDSTYNTQQPVNSGNMVTFIYSAFPRVFKEFEMICEACRLLEDRQLEFKVIFTIGGKENKYAEWLYKKYCCIKNIEWIGIQTPESMNKIYARIDALIFPSELETWGLPILEVGELGKPVLLRDTIYAHETAKNLVKKAFFKNETELAALIEKYVTGKLKYMPDKTNFGKPDCRDFEELLRLLLDPRKMSN